ncbi:hypothetical protein BKI52_16265 [marine bacterium AO1-C]|nr:hypothetical protein BKI52_16265 [marine bacterium AO1-C]
MIYPMNTINQTVDTSQKILSALHNSPLANDLNVNFINEWHQQVHLPSFSQAQSFEIWSTHNGERLTMHQMGNAKTLLKKHASYYKDNLQVDKHILQRLEKIQLNCQSNKIGSWIELNTLGVNAGWYLPGQVSFDRLYQLLEKDDLSQKILTRWANLFVDATCLGYGESLLDDTIQQIDLMIDPTQNINNQLRKALYLADLFNVPDFPFLLPKVLQTYNARQLVISLWLREKKALKFGLRFLYPSIKLIEAFCMIARFSKLDEDHLAQLHSLSNQVKWVEIQNTTKGLVVELSYQV